MNPIERTWRPDWPCRLGQVLAPLRHGGGDPTYKVTDDGAHWRGVRTPDGVATVRFESRPDEGTIHATTWGDGGAWVLHTMPRLLGADDSWSGFVAHHDVIREAWRRHPDFRFGASGLVLESLVPAIIEQKVTGQEAFTAQRRLVHRYGERAPGPGVDLKLWVAPGAEQLRTIPSWEWLKLPVDSGRSRTIQQVVRVAGPLERAVEEPAGELDRRLRSLPGVGVWTSAEVRSRALGDPDAVSFGDYHVAKDVGWALTGAPVDDDGLADLLAPYAGHRNRVPALIGLAGLRRPRRGPRMAPRTHLPS